VLLLFVTSCQKKEEVTPQPAKVNIDISSPAAAQVFHKGDTVHINAKVSYISQLHGYEVRITNKNTNTLVGELEGHVHTDNFSINETWVDTLSQAAELELEIRAVIDHDSNDAISRLTFQSQP
jgi:hypothetical protein